MRIVLDTNVLVSGLLRPEGAPAQIVDLIITRLITILLDVRIFSEYEHVLARPRLRINPLGTRIVLDFLRRQSEWVAATPIPEQLPDPGDQPFLEVAIAGMADVLVTGNLRDYPPLLTQGVHIVSPRQFLDGWSFAPRN